MKRKITGLLILAVFISMFSVTGCYNDNEARVTIHIERNDLIGQKPVQKKWFIDRILEFFSTAAYGKWYDQHTNDLTLTISSSSFDNMVFTIPAGSTSFSTTIPSGNNITFKITHIYSSQTNWGGQITTDIAPGDQEIIVQMIPITTVSASGMTGGIIVNWYSVNPVASYNLYRASSSEGPYSLRINTTLTSLSDTGLGSGKTYYYKVAVVNSYGEGLMCDAKSGTSF